MVPALHAAGRTDVALVAFGDFPMADTLRPAVTVVDHPGHEVGRAAAQRLLARLAEPGLPVERIRVPARIIERGSGELHPRWPAHGDRVHDQEHRLRRRHRYRHDLSQGRHPAGRGLRYP